MALLHAADVQVVERAFAPRFLEKVPAARTLQLFKDVGESAGACRRVRVLRADAPNTAKLELTCEKGRVLVELDADPAPPHLLRGLSLVVR